MTVLRVIGFLLGLALVLWTLVIAVRVVVLPRAAGDPVTRALFRTSYAGFRWVARRRRTYAAQDSVMALFAPLTLLLQPVVWLTLICFGYMLMFWGVGVDLWRDAFSVSGSSLLTLGFTPVEGVPQTALAFTEAVIGLGLVALLIAYLPTMYSAWKRREDGVALLVVRAGTPPTGVEMLERYHRIEGLDELPDALADWERWFIDIEESHTTAPSLVFFRSPTHNRSWVTAAGAVLDAASLYTSTVDAELSVQPQITLRAGFLSLRSIADFFGIGYEPDPERGDPIAISRAEYDEACTRLEAAGVPLKADRDEAWLDFAGWRVNYDTVLLALAGITMSPYAPWSSDRSPRRWQAAPRATRWGLRRRGAR